MFSRFFSRRALFADRFLYALPESLPGQPEEISFWTRRGVQLRGWFYRGVKPGVVVFCPGNSGNVTAHFEYVRMALETGHSTLAFDYQGFGRSEGDPDLRAILGSVEAAAEFAAFHAKEPVALFGVSIGAQAALHVACRLATGIAAVVAEGVSHLPAMLRGLFTEGSFGPIHYRQVGGDEIELRDRLTHRLSTSRVPGPLAAPISWFAAAAYPFPGKSLRGISRRLGLTPTLLIHGVEDPILPFEAALRLHDELIGPKRLWLVPGVGHAQEPALLAHHEYVHQLTDFLAGAFGGRLKPPPAARVFDIQVVQHAEGAVAAVLGLDSPGPGDDQPVTALLTATGGDALRQASLDQESRVTFGFPRPIERLFTLRLHAATTDADDAIRDLQSLQSSLRRLSRAANERDAEALEAAFEDHLRLDRQPFGDFLASLHALRAAQAALGDWPHVKAQGVAASRRALERFLELWTMDPSRPGPAVPESPAAWALARLGSLERNKG